MNIFEESFSHGRICNSLVPVCPIQTFMMGLATDSELQLRGPMQSFGTKLPRVAVGTCIRKTYNCLASELGILVMQQESLLHDHL